MNIAFTQQWSLVTQICYWGAVESRACSNMSVLLIYCQRISEHWTCKIIQLGIWESTGTFSLISLAFAAHTYGHLLQWHKSLGYFCLSKFKTSLARIGNNSHSPISLGIKIQCQRAMTEPCVFVLVILVKTTSYQDCEVQYHSGSGG